MQAGESPHDPAQSRPAGGGDGQCPVSGAHAVRIAPAVYQLDRAVSESRRLETEHQRLQVEKRAQATPLRVEKLARAQLHMRTATPAITQYVADPAGAVTSAPESQP